ncbi:adhesion G-protein coupled receptor G2-like [Hydractinia symbiolongicarpus]|uniref:adhesion G-protein coupled receptor G2-like n=1 Tax=Hydractinia symbiolongicarpus TaxID=13093 RepID=UPI00254A8E10|nr:adhesion G-protein coupled receptor G2-like [Hydractinia symbiolongicarpus]
MALRSVQEIVYLDRQFHQRMFLFTLCIWLMYPAKGYGNCNANTCILLSGAPNCTVVSCNGAFKSEVRKSRMHLIQIQQSARCRRELGCVLSRWTSVSSCKKNCRSVINSTRCNGDIVSVDSSIGSLNYFMGMVNRSKQRFNYNFDHHKYLSENKRLVYQIYKDKLPHCKDDASVSKFCPTEVIGTENYKGKYIFNSTQANNYFQVTCKYGSLHGKPVVTRRCKLSASQEAYWQDVDLTSCAAKTTTSNVLIRLAKETFTKSSIRGISSTLNAVIQNSSYITCAKDIDHVAVIIKNCLAVGTRQQEVGKNLLGSVNSILGVPSEILRISSSTEKILPMLDDIAGIFFSSNETKFEFSETNLAFKTTSIRQYDKFLLISVKKFPNRTVINFQREHKKEVQWHHDVTLLIPLAEVPVRYIANIYAYSFNNDKLFVQEKSNYSSYKTVHNITSATVKNTTIKNMTNMIELTFKLPNGAEGDGQCVFWKDKDLDATYPHWSTEGCFQTGIFHLNSNRFMTCKCNHLTNFAIILNSHEKHVTTKELEIVTYIGCSVSSITLLLGLLIYATFREVRQSTAARTLINIYISLFLLMVIFMFGVSARKDHCRCHLTSMFLHCFTLSSFAWMGVQSVCVYGKVVHPLTFSQKYTGLFWKPFFVAWGVPVIISSITSAFSIHQFKKENRFCVISGQLFIFTTLVPVSCVLVVNLILFIPIITIAYSHTSNQPWRKVKVTFSCVVLLGLTWLFGILAIGDLRKTFQWIFAIINSFYGVFLVYFQTLTNPNVKNALCTLRNSKIRSVSFYRKRESKEEKNEEL